MEGIIMYIVMFEETDPRDDNVYYENGRKFKTIGEACMFVEYLKDEGSLARKVKLYKAEELSYTVNVTPKIEE